MKILLVAYDFPPIPSPQALRWAYLARELALAGHQLQVIAPDVPGYGAGGLPVLPASIQVHRVDPGKLSRLLFGRGRKNTASQAPVGTVEASVVTAPVLLAAGSAGTVAETLNWKGRLRRKLERSVRLDGGLNWKGRLAEKIKDVVSQHTFPDHRVEWVPHAIAKLDELILAQRPDVVVVSHEPACTLPVGLAAVERGLPLAVDMGDPVLATYTPPKWRGKALALERAVCDAATLVTVTTDAAVKLLLQRHSGLRPERTATITQGFDPSFDAVQGDRVVEFDPKRLELLYTGSFYSFRRAEALLSAVTCTPGVRLSVATINAPDYLQKAAEQNPESIRIVGFLPHRAALEAQRRCDVLVNLANADPVQVPGKVFEYLGAGRPLLHLRGPDQDATGAVITQLQAGWDLATDESAIVGAFLQMQQLKKDAALHERAADRAAVAKYGWPALAQQWTGRLQDLLHPQSGRRSM